MIKSKYQVENSFLVVVGCNSGIGIPLIKQLLNAGATVFGVDIQNESKNTFSGSFHYFQANPLEKDSLSKVVREIERQTSYIDGLVNLSGTITQFKSIESTSYEEWNETYDISFKSCFNACKAFMTLLKAGTSSAVVNMSSGLAFIGQKKYGPYSAAKAAVVSFSKTLAAELAPEIRVNTVAPGAVDTDFIYKEDGSTRFDKEAYKKMVPLGEMAKPEEIGSVILFLLSDGASHMTGQCLHVNGGAGMH
ncbi:MAG: SDR family oxidoreductase [Maribacter sp.]|uniref:SDR family NAD(P)-dependent oxidoreductase n=1 Tax=Maribacter sp. TaxID=1897614 RepID=UPI0032991C9A